MGRVGLPGRGAGGRRGLSEEQQGSHGHWTGPAAALGTWGTPQRGVGGGVSWEQYNPTVRTSLDLRSRAQTAGEVGREEAEMAQSIQRLLRGGDRVGRGSMDGRTLESLPRY